MKSLFILTLLAAALTPVFAQAPASQDPISTEPDFIFIQEINLWRVLQNHDLAAFHALLLPDFLYVQRAIQTREQIMDNLNTCTLSNFKFRNHQLRMITPDIAVLAYTASSETTCGESHLTGNYNATTTWVHRDGKWLVQLHTEIPIKP
jgi:Domain of unknown function (DUF4440)